MPKKPPLKRTQTPSPITSPKIPLPDALREIVRRSRALEEIRLRATSIREDCYLELALALMQTKDELGISWETMASQFFGTCNQNTLHKLANRDARLSGKKYKGICTQLNNFRARENIKQLDFPEWAED